MFPLITHGLMSSVLSLFRCIESSCLHSEVPNNLNRYIPRLMESDHEESWGESKLIVLTDEFLMPWVQKDHSAFFACVIMNVI